MQATWKKRLTLSNGGEVKTLRLLDKKLAVVKAAHIK